MLARGRERQDEGVDTEDGAEGGEDEGEGRRPEGMHICFW